MNLHNDEFTPTTPQVRQAFILGSDEDGASIDFDRWLAAHDADILSTAQRAAPADQRTADRETIARALWLSIFFEADEQQWADMSNFIHEAYLRHADAVLAVLVPADLIRAEALEGAAIELSEWGDLPPVTLQAWLRARAAEYRKAASRG
jgi:hypothetical protein